MIYNEAVTYSSSNITYDGTLVIYASSLIDPITLNNVTIFYSANQDYSNYTSIGVVSVDISPYGVITVEVLDQDLSALISAQVISVGVNNEIAIIA